jgi:hypothetical protein
VRPTMAYLQILVRSVAYLQTFVMTMTPLVVVVKKWMTNNLAFVVTVLVVAKVHLGMSLVVEIVLAMIPVDFVPQSFVVVGIAFVVVVVVVAAAAAVASTWNLVGVVVPLGLVLSLLRHSWS